MMLRKLCIASFGIFLFISMGYAQSETITIKSDQLDASNYLKIDDFYLTHHLYIDLFLRENLAPNATVEDVSKVLKAIKTYVSVETSLEIEIEKADGNNYLIKMAIIKKDNGPELLIAFTNWSPQKKMFEKEIKLENDSYTRWYFLNGNKMTYRKDMSDQNDYATMLGADLVNAYLFDELPDNDSKIKGIIDDLLKISDLKLSDSIFNHLLLLKYYMLQRDADNAAKQTEYLNELFKNNTSDPNLKGVQMAFDATKFQIDLMK